MCRACHYLCCEDRNEARCGCNDCPNPACRCDHDGEEERRDPNDGDRTFDDEAPAMVFSSTAQGGGAGRVTVGFRELC